jgi:hypothetical protein
MTDESTDFQTIRRAVFEARWKEGRGRAEEHGGKFFRLVSGYIFESEDDRALSADRLVDEFGFAVATADFFIDELHHRYEKVGHFTVSNEIWAEWTSGYEMPLAARDYWGSLPEQNLT